MQQSETIRVQEIINSPNAVTPASGVLLYEKILSNLKEQIETFIDFNGIKYLNTAFLNSAIGQLYATYERDQLNSYLHIINISDSDLIIFKKVTNRARHFFNEKPEDETLNTSDE